jgi:N-formylglutamate amidohydrolase
MTDWFTDDLFELPSVNSVLVRYQVSRLVVDPERFLEDDLEPMAARGMGVIYTATSLGTPLRTTLLPSERNRLIERFYVPHHARLQSEVASSLQRDGAALIIDCHSFPSSPLPYEMYQSLNRPDICLGQDSFHTPAGLTSLAASTFRNTGLSVDIDRPFAGTIVPKEYYQKDASVRSLMIEVNRRLYMNELMGTRAPDYATFKTRFVAALRTIVNDFRSEHVV